MGLFDTFGKEQIQLKNAGRNMQHFEVGEEVPLRKGIYVGHEGFVVVDEDSKLIGTFKKNDFRDKYDDIIVCDFLELYQMKKVFNDYCQMLESPEKCYYYALHVVKGRFEPGEEAIATSAQWSYYYAQQILRDRFELGEPVIVREGWSYNYALYIVRGRFELGEPAIATSAQFSYDYARHVLNDRFELGEPAILNSVYKDVYLDWLRMKHISSDI